ncbi:ABC transporter permease [Aliidiomarina iranensis]|uniref:ABC transporter permease n=1 Tax=Aliidiomarina iranensis TaxID=1434071 RepID=A0A432W0D6_9GAMM|nr:ABC transporter permease [Aliidiomarina iranensis]RUO22489.1 ABC transporter permease [Aliidiomarina iranensis]
MRIYVLRQLALLIITLFLLTVFAFCLSYWFPGNPVTNSSGIFTDDTLRYTEAFEARGFDHNILVQYWFYLEHLFRGDWGISLLDADPVFEQLKLRFGATLEIALLAMLLAIIPGIAFGVLAALNFRKPIDHIILSISLSGYSIPVFWFAQIAILVVAVHWGVLPIAGQINPLFHIEPLTGSILLDIFITQPENIELALRSAIRHIMLPVLVLSVMPMMLLIRLTRSSMLDVLDKNYITSAYAKGLSTRRVIASHAIPNTMQNVIRELGSMLSLLITNTMIIEVIFSWPGIGSWLIRSIYERDYPVIQGGLLMIAALILCVHVGLNLIHSWRYPQVRKDLNAAS